jgi:hypothetical protein
MENPWTESFSVIEGASFLRLVYSFESKESSFHQRVQQAVPNSAGRWKSARSGMVAEAKLAGHAAVLFGLDGPASELEVLAWTFQNRNEHEPVPREVDVQLPKEPELARLRFEKVELWHFAGGLGYLVLELKVKSPNLRVWLNAVHHLRFLRNDNRVQALVITTAAGERVETNLESIISKVLLSLAPENGVEWSEIDLRDMLRPLMCLSVGPQSEPLRPRNSEDSRRLLYHVCELAPPHRPMHMPKGEFLRGDFFEYSEGAHFVASRDGCSFVAIDQAYDHEFWKATMVGHLRTGYFTHYLLTQFQRHSIERLRRLVEHATRDTSIDDEEWQKLREQSAQLRASGYFVELASTNNHARFERMIRGMAQLDRLFDLTTRAVDDLVSLKIEAHESEQSRRQVEFQSRWEWIGVPVAATGLALGFFSMNLRGITTAEEGVGFVQALVGLLVWIGFFVAVGLRFRRRHRTVRRQR